MIPTALDVLAARRRICAHVRRTPLHESAWLGRRSGACVLLKLENVQLTGSFKIRGALNALMRIVHNVPAKTSTPDEPATSPARNQVGGDAPIHIVAASAGNHGRAIAYAAQQLHVRATVFTPHDAPRTKIDAIRRHGAIVKQVDTYDAAEAGAKHHARTAFATFVSPYNHPDIVSGAGTIGIEILEETPDIDSIVVPVGGGGLIAGIAIAVKAVAPSVRVVGVEAEASTAIATSLRHKRITRIDPQPTIADGLAGNIDPESITFPIIQRYVDEMVTVSESELSDAIRGLVREEHQIAEGAGAAAVAAVMSARSRGNHLVVVVSGGNIDSTRLAGLLNA
jgi:threonine dehydratase